MHKKKKFQEEHDGMAGGGVYTDFEHWLGRSYYRLSQEWFQLSAGGRIIIEEGLGWNWEKKNSRAIECRQHIQ